MAREIKFRGFSISRKQWVYGYYNYTFERGYWPQGYDDVPPRCYYIDTDTNYYEVYSQSVGQYTGLKDKNGVEIYEGDIIHASGHYPGVGWYDTGEHDYDFTAPVKWNKEKATYTCKQYYLHELDRIVVVGNIHDRDDIKEGD